MTHEEQNGLVEALRKLLDASTTVSRLGASTGPHWVPFSSAIITARERLAALQAPQEAGVAVKMLEWDVDGLRATCAFGVYTVSRTADGYSAAFGDDELVHVGFNAVDVFYGAKRAAQDHAQADFENRIRSALSQPVATPAPSQGAAVVERTPLRDSIAAVMFQTGTPDQQIEALTYAHGKLPATRPAEAQAVAEGWKLVPIEPTEAMIEAASDFGYGGGNSYSGIYRAMLAASPATGGA